VAVTAHFRASLSSGVLCNNVNTELYGSMIVPVVLRGFEVQSLKFVNRVLKGMFGPNRDEVTGGSRKLRNRELRNLYSSLNVIRMMKSKRISWAGHVARMGR
jgi:hypothetical protein